MKHIDQIFEPIFAFKRATAESGGWNSLKEYLQCVSGTTDRIEDEMPPLVTTYYHYHPNIAVLFEHPYDGFCCFTIEDGKYGKNYNVERNKEQLREFFKRHPDDITVLEEHQKKMLKPTFEALYTYVVMMKKIRRVGQHQRKKMLEFHRRLYEFHQENKEGFDRNPETLFPSALRLGEQYLETLDDITRTTRAKRQRIAATYLQDNTDNRHVLLGLFLYALQLGQYQSRYLKPYHRNLSHVFSNMLDDFHQFLQENPNIEEEYAAAKNLPENERAKLHELLVREGLYDEEWGYIGNSLF